MEIEKQLVNVRIAEMIVLMSKQEGNAAQEKYSMLFYIIVL